MKVKIVADPEPMDPREWEPTGNMYCWHNRYNLGDKHNYDPDTFMRELACEASPELEEQLEEIEYEADQVWDAARPNYDSWDECTESVNGKAEKLVTRLIEAALADHVILPLSLYDHSGITISVGVHRGWDSGQVGYIVLDKKTIDKEFDGSREKAEKSLYGEVETYDDYLTGNVYGYIVEDDGGEVIDSCWGFHGYDPQTNGMADHLGSDELVELACNAEVEYS